MFKIFSAALCAAAMAAPAMAQSAPAAGGEEKVLVVGQRPGPGLWKISKDEHVLWVFGTYGPLPKKMEWRSQQVEQILGQSQEAIAPPTASPKLGFFRTISLVPQVLGIMNNPDGARLKDLLSPDVYARWEIMRTKYLGEKDLERLRPLFAAEELYEAGLATAGLTSKGEVSTAVAALVKKSKVRLTRVDLDIPLQDPAAAIKQFKRAPLDDAACLAKTLDRLESDIEGMKERANAWAKGDLARIRTLDFDRDSACKDAVMSSAAMRSAIRKEDVDARLREAWLGAAEQALADNASTFAVLSIKNLLDPHGYLAALQAKGYQIEAPD